MNQRVSKGTARSTRRGTGPLVGGIVLALLLAAVLWEGQPWRNTSGSLVDTRWRIDTVRGALMTWFAFPAFIQFMPHQTIFGADELLGEDACNALQGTYSITGNQIRFSEIGSTLVGCAGPDVMGALSDTRTYQRSGNRLHLYDAGGAVTLELTWSSTLGIDSNPAAPKPTGNGSPPAVDESKMAVESPSATNT